MAEIIYRLPSKVPYGYIEVKYSAEDVNTIFDTCSPEELADDYIRTFTRFRQAEEKALTAPNSAPPKSKPPIVRSVSEIMSDEDVDTEKQAKEILIKELGAVEVEDDEPWNNKPEPTKKEWEAPSDSSWDFS